MSEGRGSDQPHRYCTNCGTQIRSGNAFCGSCGAALPPSPPRAEQVIPKDIAARAGAGAGRKNALTWILGLGALLVLLVVGGALAAAGFFEGGTDARGGAGPTPVDGKADPTAGEESTVGGEDTYESAPPLQVTSAPPSATPENTTVSDEGVASGGSSSASPAPEDDYEIVRFEDGTTTLGGSSPEYSFANIYLITDDPGLPGELARYYVDEYGYDIVVVEGETATPDPIYGKQSLQDSAFSSIDVQQDYMSWKTQQIGEQAGEIVRNWDRD